MPAAHQRSAIFPSRQRFTLVEWSRQISIIDSIAFVDRSVRASVGGTVLISALAEVKELAEKFGEMEELAAIVDAIE